MSLISPEDFASAVKDLSLTALAEAVKLETGHTLKSRSKADGVAEAYEAYKAHAKAKSKAPEASSVAAPPEPPAASVKPPPPAASPKPSPLSYEGRSRTGRAFHKGGRVFGVKWADLGAVSAEELAHLEQFKAFIQVRIKG